MSPTPKAQRLLDRLSINPDEQPPAPARPAPAATPDPPVDAPPPSSEVEQAQQPPETTPQPAVPHYPAPPRTPGRAERRRSAPAPAHVSAVDDPSITAGRKDYRSFYIEDATFARFRAAIYWLARREDATGEVPENMSVAVETWMQETANELEQRYNNGETFRMPPVSRRRRNTS